MIIVTGGAGFIGTNLMEIIEPHGKGLGHLFDSGKISADYPLMFAVFVLLKVYF